MSAIALRTYPLLSRLDDTGLPLWKLYLVTLIASAAVALLLTPASYLVNPENPLAPQFTPELMAVKLFINCLLCGFTLFCCIALTRTTEADLESLVALDPDIEPALSHLQPGTRPSLLMAAGWITFLVAFSPILVLLNTDASVHDVILIHLTAGVGPALILAVMPVLVGGSVAIACMLVAAQIRTLVYVARTIRVDLLNLERYIAIASPFMRYVIVVLFVFSGFPPIILMDNPDLTRGLGVVSIVFAVVYLPILAGYFTPVVILRNRIRDVKQSALAALRSPDPVEGLLPALALPGYTDVSPPDRLTQVMFVESRWEWPVASHIQRLLLFGMLPPLTWVMAAMVENFLF